MPAPLYHLPDPTARVVTLEDLRRRFGKPTVRSAKKLLRQMRHVQDGMALYTTEAWLAEFLAARAVPAVQPKKAPSYNPLEEAVISRAVALVREMVARGELTPGANLKEAV